MISAAIIIGGIVWVMLVGDAYLVTHRKRVQRAKPVDVDEEHDLIYNSPRMWIYQAIERFLKEGD